MMNLKKTALASAITLALAGGPAFAETTTVKGAFILDATEIEAGGVVNLALLGLNKDEEVDLYGERDGAVIIAVVSSNIGKVIGGSIDPGELPNDPVDGGNFAASVKYVKLTQGTGRVHISYAPDTNPGTDTIEVELLERAANPEGGVNFKTIAKTTKKIKVNQSGSGDPGCLDIAAFKASPADAMGMSDCTADKACEQFDIMSMMSPKEGINGAMTVGIQGGQIIVDACNSLAAGNVTVTLREIDNDDCVSEQGCYTYPAEMQRGRAIVTIDDQVTVAGKYYVEATFEGFEGDSVDMFYEDTLKVHSTGIPKGLQCTSWKDTVAKPADDFVFPADSSCGVGQGTRIACYTEDEYGNVTSNGTGGDLRIAVQDSAGVFSNTALSLKIPANSPSGVTVAAGENNPTTDSVVGNAKDEILKIGTTSLVAIAVDSASEPIASIAPSEPLAVKVVADGLKAEALFNTSQLAGTKFDAFTVYVTDGNCQVKVDNETKPIDPGPVTLGSSGGEEITVNRQNDAPYDVKALFRKATPNGTYLVGDKAGNYGQVSITVPETNPTKINNGRPEAGIDPAAATVVELQNAHEVAQTQVDPGPLTSDKKYITGLPESAFRMFDDYGNSVMRQQPPPLTEDDTGTFTVTSSNGTVSYNTPELNRGIPGRVFYEMGTPTTGAHQAKSSRYAYVTYDTTETPPFAGEDAIQVNFTEPGLGANSLVIKSVVPAAQKLGSIKLNIERTTLPVDSEVAMTVMVMDQNGNILAGKNKASLTLRINGVEGDNITPVVAELTASTTISTPEVCNAAGGTFNYDTAYIEDGILVGECTETTETPVNSGQSLDFGASGGRKVFVIDAGANEGQFSLTLADANDPNGVKETKTFEVKKRVEEDPCIKDPTLPQCPQPEITPEECLAEGGLHENGECTILPPLTENDESFVLNPDGSISTSKVNITGGMSVDGGSITNPASASLADESEIRFVGVVGFDPDDEGKEVDIIAIADYQVSPLAANAVGGGVFFLQEGGVALLMGAVADIEPFYADPHTVAKDDEGNIIPKVVEIYKGPFVKPPFVASNIRVNVGYRLDGTIYFNPVPIELHLNP